MAFRTDRHNNPTAFTTDLARQAGLIEGVDFVEGDPFPNNPKLKTARLLGDPIEVTKRLIDNAGFYTQGGKQRWSYFAMPPEMWSSLSDDQKRNIILGMYKIEGGSGELANAPSGNRVLGYSTAVSPSAPIPQLGQGMGFMQPTDFSNLSAGNAPSPTMDMSGMGSQAGLGGTMQLSPESGMGALGTFAPSDFSNITQGLGDNVEKPKGPTPMQRAKDIAFQVKETAKALPAELVKEGAKTFFEPETKAAASGLRAVQATPGVAKSAYGALKDLAKGDFIDIKTGKKMGRLEALANPMRAYSPSAYESAIKATDVMAKPVMGQKTFAGSTIPENIKTATTAALQAAGASKLPVSGPSGLAGGAKGKLAELAKYDVGAKAKTLIGGAKKVVGALAPNIGPSSNTGLLGSIAKYYGLYKLGRNVLDELRNK